MPSDGTDREADPDCAEPTRVVLLHGLGGRSTVWDDFAERVAVPVELWEVELPWRTFGDSRWSHQGDPGDAIAEAVGNAQAVVAHSYSASLLLEQYSAGRLEPRPSVLVSPFYRASPDDFDWTTISYYLNEFHQTFLEALRMGDTAAYPEARRAWLAEQLRGQVGPYGWMRFFASYLNTPFLDLAAIGSPTLVLTGELDIAAPPTDGRRLAAALPDARFVELARCGHFPMVQQPADFAREVSAFLRTAVPTMPRMEPT
jgi:pimeloyl-ACP methyl ester carboxylesterase